MIDEKNFSGSQYCFLLGGYDLEMLEIKKLLESHGQRFIDHQLSWGAKLSSYASMFDASTHFIGVELIEDRQPPKNYTAIDHHGKSSVKNSAIEQVAHLLGIELNHYQQLVAANDKGYIPAMKCLGASDNEIALIRNRDRAAQGVSEAVEQQAEEEVQNLTLREGVYVLQTTLQHFSALVDRIEKRPLIVYRDDALIYYGHKVDSLRKSFTCNDSECYYGGNPLGYFGLTKDFFSTHDIDLTIEEIIALHQEETLYSYHTFMFPFVFKTGSFKSQIWEYSPFNINYARDYNEFTYFYKHVQDAIFNDMEENDSFISKYYQHPIQNGIFTISTRNGKYDLELDGLSLRLFNTDVAILSINLINRKYPDADDVLRINDYGRRIYPQFLGVKNFTQATKNAFLPCSVTLHLEGYDSWEERFDRYDAIEQIQKRERMHWIALPRYIQELIGNSFEDIRPIIDDRMFVLCQYHDSLNAKLKAFNGEMYQYEIDSFWYRYLFVDGEYKTCQSNHMSRKLLAESTYDRWVEYGTLFGITRYSFMALTGSEYGKNILLPHIQTIYFQMFTLLLAYRASIIKFADDIQNGTKNDKEIRTEAKNVYHRYLKFLNKLYFREVTAQEQGIELYAQAIKIMGIDKAIDDLDREINELYSYAKLLQEQERTESMDNISMLGSYLLVPALLTSFLGMNIIDFDNYRDVLGDEKSTSFWTIIFILSSISFFPIFLHIKKWYKKYC